MGGGDFFRLVEVGDGAADAEDFVVGAGGEAHFFHGGAEEAFGILFELAEFANFTGAHFTVEERTRFAVAFALDFATLEDGLAHLLAGLSAPILGEFSEGDGGDFDVDVDAVEQGTGELADVAFDLLGGAVALAFGVAPEAAGAGIQSGDEHEVGGEGGGAVGAGDGDLSFFEGLAKDFEGAAIEFGEFVQE